MYCLWRKQLPGKLGGDLWLPVWISLCTRSDDRTRRAVYSIGGVGPPGGRLVGMILLDSQVSIWLLTARERLSAQARDSILQARAVGEKLRGSPVSLDEIEATLVGQHVNV